jgi:hypothetical protein
MKVDKTTLIGIVVVIIIFIIIFYVLNSNKDNEDRLDQLERSLEGAGIKTVEAFKDTSTGYTRNELTEMIDLYYPKSKCLLEKGFTDGLTNDQNDIVKFAENSEGKVVIDGTSILLNPEMIVQVFAMKSLVFSLENDNIDDWYNAFIGVISVMGGQDGPEHMFATFDRDHEDPYSTLAVYMPRRPSDEWGSDSTWSPSTNPDDFVEAISFTESPTNSDGSRVNNIKYTARVQFDRNKDKIDLLKNSNFSKRIYDEMVACNSN